MGYKLLTRDMKTRKGAYNETDWSDVGEWHKASWVGGLCTGGVIHYYDDPWLAVMMNPAHANIQNPIMYETEQAGWAISDGLKCGCKRLRLVRRIPTPKIPTEQRVAFGIYAALEVCHDAGFVGWANAWLSGSDRSAISARATARAAAALAAANAAARAAAALADALADVRASARAAALAAANAAARAAAALADARAAVDWQAVKAKATQIK
jgi:hypothetical protein